MQYRRSILLHKEVQSAPKSSKPRKTSWGARIRTSEWLDQNQLPYHLATPQLRERISILLKKWLLCQSWLSQVPSSTLLANANYPCWLMSAWAKFSATASLSCPLTIAAKTFSLSSLSKVLIVTIVVSLPCCFSTKR
jgi:hypothetical protein